jgi:hypothetical protein
MESQRKTSRELGERFAEEEGLLFAEASAKTGDGVEELFMDIGGSALWIPFLFPVFGLESELTVALHILQRCAIGPTTRTVACR